MGKAGEGEVAPADADVGNQQGGQVQEGKPQRREKRAFDRRSGNPQTSQRNKEKREGGGRNNWGKSTENPDDVVPEEQATPEETEEKPENAEEQVPEEPKEPEIPILSLDEYEKSLSVAEEVTVNMRKVEGDVTVGFRNEKVWAPEHQYTYGHGGDKKKKEKKKKKKKKKKKPM